MHTLLRTVVIFLLLAAPALAENHRVLMLNKSSEGGHPNVFEPAILYAKPGDTVTFVPTDKGHNSASKRGMLPDGAEPWNGKMNQELTVELPVPGIYGYVCVPHYTMGMIGLIVVGDEHPNLEEAKKARHPGKARSAFRELFEQLENGG